MVGVCVCACVCVCVKQWFGKSLVQIDIFLVPLYLKFRVAFIFFSKTIPTILGGLKMSKIPGFNLRFFIDYPLVKVEKTNFDAPPQS